MRMEIEVSIGIPLHHFPEVLYALQWVHDAQRVGKHEAFDAAVTKSIHQLVDV